MLTRWKERAKVGTDSFHERGKEDDRVSCVAQDGAVVDGSQLMGEGGARGGR